MYYYFIVNGDVMLLQCFGLVWFGWLLNLAQLYDGINKNLSEFISPSHIKSHTFFFSVVVVVVVVASPCLASPYVFCGEIKVR